MHVAETGWLSTGLLRIVFTGEDLNGFAAGEFTDHYVKLHLPPPGASYEPPFDSAVIRATAPREHWPRTRTYTVRAWDPEHQRLTLDFVVHGNEGVAGPWAVQAEVGDRLQLTGPGGAYAPDPNVDWHLFIGDESALPAIAAALERIPAGSPAHALLQVPDEGHEIDLPSPAALTIDWFHGHDEQTLAVAIAELSFAPGSVQAFVHGEAAMVRAVRLHLLRERGLPRDALSASGYWKLRRTEDGWREEKAEWNRLAEADLAS